MREKTVSSQTAQNRFREVFKILCIITLVLGGPILSGGIALAQEESEQKKETEKGLESDSLHQISSNAKVVRAEWLPKQDKVKLKIKSQRSTTITAVDKIKVDNKVPTQGQIHNIDAGTTVITVNAKATGWEAVGQTQALYLFEENVYNFNPVSSGGMSNVHFTIEWYTPAVSTGIAVILLGAFRHRKRLYKARRDAKDLITDKDLPVGRDYYIFKKNNKLEGWDSKLKYHYLKKKYQAKNNLIYNEMMLLAYLGMLFIVDRVVFNSYLFYTISSINNDNELMILGIGSAFVGWIAAGKILDRVLDIEKVQVIAFDSGEMAMLDISKLEGATDVLDLVQDKGDRANEGWAVLEMSKTVFNNLDNLLDEELHEVEYRDGSTIKTARRIDLKLGEILPDHHALNPISKTKKEAGLVKENNMWLRGYIKTLFLLRAQADLLEFTNQANAFRQVGEMYQKAFGEIKDGEHHGIEQAIEDIQNQVKKESKQGDKKDLVDKLQDSMDWEGDQDD